MPNKKTKFWNVAVDYRTVGFPGCTLRTVKADTKQAALDEVLADLKHKHINLQITGTAVQPSGWSR